MKLGDITDIAVSGLVAQRARMAATASNVANAQTTRTDSGGVYRRRDPVFRAEPVAGPFAGRLERALHRVEVERVVLDARAPLTRFEPGHPDADADGYVALPRVNVVEELSNMMSAARSYESNLIILRKVREMKEAAMQIGR
jgi:flagellar basal-body rod protein FlgC